MKLLTKLLCAAALALLLCFAASAKEVVVYENSFDGASALSDFTVRGSWSVKMPRQKCMRPSARSWG